MRYANFMGFQLFGGLDGVVEYDDPQYAAALNAFERLPALMKRELPSTVTGITFKLLAAGLDKERAYHAEREIVRIPEVTFCFFGRIDSQFLFQVEATPGDDLPALEAALWKCITDQGGLHVAAD